MRSELLSNVESLNPLDIGKRKVKIPVPLLDIDARYKPLNLAEIEDLQAIDPLGLTQVLIQDALRESLKTEEERAQHHPEEQNAFMVVQDFRNALDDIKAGNWRNAAAFLLEKARTHYSLAGMFQAMHEGESTPLIQELFQSADRFTRFAAFFAKQIT